MRLQVQTPAGAMDYETDLNGLRIMSRVGTKTIEWNQIVGAGPFGFHIPIHIPIEVPDHAPRMVGLMVKAEQMLETNQTYWIAYKPRRGVKLVTLSVPRTGDAAAQLVAELREHAGANWRTDPALKMQDLRREFGIRRHWWAVPLALLVLVLLLIAGLIALLATSAVLALLHDVRIALVVLFVGALWFVVKQFRAKPEGLS